jgi:hypothetical protein
LRSMLEQHLRDSSPDSSSCAGNKTDFIDHVVSISPTRARTVDRHVLSACICVKRSQSSSYCEPRNPVQLKQGPS